MSKCAAKGIYESLDWCPGQTVLPGIRQKVLGIPKSWIAAWPTLPAIGGDVTKMAALASYTGNFTLAADKKWMSITVLTAKSNISSETQGETPSKTFLNKATLLYAGTDEDATGFCRQAIIDQFIFAIPQRNGKYRILGSEAFDPDVKVSQSSGEGDTGAGGTTIEAQSTDVCPSPFYPGKLETDDGDISGANGGAWPTE